MQPEPIIYDDDTRYPGPDVHPPPGYITGIPTQRELDAQARMFTWGELKGIVGESWPRCSSILLVPSHSDDESYARWKRMEAGGETRRTIRNRADDQNPVI